MKRFNRFLLRHSGILTSLALAVAAGGGFGKYCRTWFFQPEVPRE